MPMHDWTRVEAGIYHAFHHDWITELARVLNGSLLPDEYYALPEQQAAGFGPDVLTLQTQAAKKSSVVVRHVSDDHTVSMLEVVSPRNKTGRHAIQAFVNKACELLEQRIHLLILDPFPPGPIDPNGIHEAIWAAIYQESFVLPMNKPLTLVAYEYKTTRAYIDPIAVGDSLPNMPIFLESGRFVFIPLEETYTAAFVGMPRRWQIVLEPSSP